MHPNALLELTTELIHRVLQLQHPADSVVSDFFRQHRALGSRERHTLAETTYAVLRQRLLFQHLAQSGKGEMERRLALLAWQGNEGFLRAALSETEQQWLVQVGAVDRAALPDKLRHNLPEWLAEILQAEHGDEFWPLVEAMNVSAGLDLRVKLGDSVRKGQHLYRVHARFEADLEFARRMATEGTAYTLGSADQAPRDYATTQG